VISSGPLAALALVLAGAPAAPARPPSSPARAVIVVPPEADRSAPAAALVDAYRRAHDARDAKAFAALVEWKDVTSSTRQAVLRSFEVDLGLAIQVSYLTPVDPEESYEYTLNSVTYRPNLEPVRVLHVCYDLADGGVLRVTYLVGRVEDGSYRIAAAAPTP
jgi:hypothetical protein